MSVSAAILGCAGTTLSREEVAFFRDVKPWGFILFARNVESPDQVRALTLALRETTGREDAPILIDQEGGRVQRLVPPHWNRYPPGRAYGRLVANDPLVAREIARIGNLRRNSREYRAEAEKRATFVRERQAARRTTGGDLNRAREQGMQERGDA